MQKDKKSKHFINVPQYPGGKKAFGEFIHQHLKYPEEALNVRIQGRVHVSFQVNDYGEVISAEVLHGLGYGCDEEALRVVKLLKYDKAKNRGIRLISTVKTFIEFKLPVQSALQYTIVKDKPAVEAEVPKKTEGESYTYTISF
ncbi:MAG: energy transducer TonB [Bacteroidota bacterium]